MLFIYMFLLLFTFHLESGECWFSFFHFNCPPTTNSSLDLPPEEEELEEAEDVEPELPEVYNHLSDDCCPVSFQFIINPYEEPAERRPGVMSACLKCAICLAVAENVEDLFAAIVKKHVKRSPECERQCLGTELKSLCKSGFVNYDLRDFQGFTLLTNAYSQTTHVRTRMDGQWTQMLRTACGELLDRLDEYVVYSAYKSVASLNVTDYLCRGFGAFGECNNIKYESVRVPADDDTLIKFWVHCLFH